MSEGELLKSKARRLDITEDIYEIIEKNCNTYRCLLCARAQSVIDDELQVENMRVNSSEWRFK
jgi:hypothetical protein